MRIWNDKHSWYAHVVAPMRVRCGKGLIHDMSIDHRREITTKEDSATMNAYEWAIRGKDDAMVHLAQLLVQEYLDRVWLDPCLVPSK